ncbi:hypothetical protein GCM10007159_06590 [Modicisalibacter luteus]|nr:hypothetical protein GCM10007159_06590 [Halomonas lutea]
MRVVYNKVRVNLVTPYVAFTLLVQLKTAIIDSGGLIGGSLDYVLLNRASIHKHSPGLEKTAKRLPPPYMPAAARCP